MNRRQFLGMATTLGLGAVLTPSSVLGKRIFTEGKVRWKMLVAWHKDMEIFKHFSFQFARQISLLSESRLAIDVRLMEPDESLQNVMEKLGKGEVDCVHCFSDDLAFLEPALQWFGSVPFGLSATGYNAWLYEYGGAGLWKKICVPFGFYPYSLGDTGQGGFGWSRQAITTLSQLKGLRMPAKGLTKDVLTHLGVRVIPPADGKGTVQGLRQKALDTAAWHGPYHEYQAGLPKAAPFYHIPGWQARAGRMMLCVNQVAFEKLDSVIRKIIPAVAAELDMRCQSRFVAANATALTKLKAEKIKTVSFAEKDLKKLEQQSRKIINDIAGTPLSRRVQNSYQNALKKMHTL